MERRVRGAVRDKADFAGRNAINCFQQLHGFVGHDDKAGGVVFHFFQYPPLRLGRVGQDRVQGDNDRHGHGANQIQDILAVIAAEDAVFMLNRQQADFVLFQQLGRPDIIGFVFFFNRVNDFGVGMRLGRARRRLRQTRWSASRTNRWS